MGREQPCVLEEDNINVPRGHVPQNVLEHVLSEAGEAYIQGGDVEVTLPEGGELLGRDPAVKLGR